MRLLSYKIAFLFILTTTWAYSQCPKLLKPTNGQSNVSVNTSIEWENPANQFTSVSLTLTAITIDSPFIIVNNRTSGIDSFFKPETGLPEETDFVLKILFFQENIENPVECTYYFSTKAIDEKPECTRLTEPIDEETNVLPNTTIKWQYAANATGYRISLGTSPGGTDLSNNQDLDVGNTLEYDPPGNLPSDQLIYVKITPYNRIGGATGCSFEYFKTGSSNVDCEPQRPQIKSIPRLVGLCKERGFTDLRVLENADDYEWFQFDSNGQEFSIAKGDSLRIAETGTYRLIASNRVGSSSDYTVCETVYDFEVIEVGIPQISNIRAERDASGLNISIETEGDIAYEYALNDGPFQTSPNFRGYDVKAYTAFVRAPFGCGIDSLSVARKLSAADFPAFFTPNGDEINECWKFDSPDDLPQANLDYINIFDRYGNFIKRVSPDTGWDGTNQSNKPMLSSVYWFEAVAITKEVVVRGYFALIRSRD